MSAHADERRTRVDAVAVTVTYRRLVSLEGNTRRAIDFYEGETIDEEALKALVRAAVILNETRA